METMSEDIQKQEGTEDPARDTEEEGGWKEEARKWYEELKGQEGLIAPWLELEWTGERMKVNRG